MKKESFATTSTGVRAFEIEISFCLNKIKIHKNNQFCY